MYYPPNEPERIVRSQLPCGLVISGSGFTLMEILVAIVIFAVLMGAVFGTFLSIQHSAEALRWDDAYYASARTALRRMCQDLAAIYVTRPPLYRKPGFNEPKDPYRVVGEPSRIGGGDFAGLRYTGLSHVPFNGDSSGGVAEIVYYVQKETQDGTYTLRRSDSLWPYEEDREYRDDPVLCENLKNLEFKFYSPDGDTLETWDSDDSDTSYATPRAVEIILTVGDETHSVTLRSMARLPTYREAIE